MTTVVQLIREALTIVPTSMRLDYSIDRSTELWTLTTTEVYVILHTKLMLHVNLSGVNGYTHVLHALSKEQ